MVLRGFFSEEEQEIYIDASCDKCKLYLGCHSPKMKATGKGRKKILVVAEAPGKTEDEQGVQLIGEAGQVLRRALDKYGIDLDKDCWKTNAVVCRPPKNRTPSKKEIKCCNPNLMKVIASKKPNLIILLGGVALDSFLLDKFTGASGGINKWRGFVIPDQKHKVWVTSTFHPSYILRSRGVKSIETLFEKDLKNAVKYANKKVPIEPEYKIRTIPDKTIPPLTEEVKLLAFDYETTGLKPYAKGHEIVCCAISYKENYAEVFEMTNKMKKLWVRILKNKNIKKTAHNLKFEHQWGREILGVTTRGWKWDSMIAAHVLDNRKGITGLKFQAYINFGQSNYSSHIEKYLKSESGIGFNKIHEAPVEDLHKYCGMDALLQYKLAVKQRGKFK